MTTLLGYLAALALSAVLVRKMWARRSAARTELQSRNRPPVVFEQYEKAIPKALTAKQLANLKERRARMDAREYRERPYMN